MVRSIVSYLKLWLKMDFSTLNDIKKLPELLIKYDIAVMKLLQQSRSNTSSQSPPPLTRFNTTKTQVNGFFNHVAGDNKNSHKHLVHPNSNPDASLSFSPKKGKSLMKSTPNNNIYHVSRFAIPSSPIQKFQFRNTVGENPAKRKEWNEYEHKTFGTKQGRENSKNSTEQSSGLGSGGSYFPSKTTHNAKHPIVQFIKSQNIPEEYKQNKLMLSE